MSQASVYPVIITVTAVGLTLALLYGWRKYLQPDREAAQGRWLGTYSPLLTWVKYRRLPRLQTAALLHAWRERSWAPMLEVGLITFFALWVGRQYLPLDATRWPTGGDWPLNLQGYFPWTWLTRCGACVFWNGSLNGGYPAFVELVAAIVHPAVVAAILLVGVVAASKLTVVMGLIMAGWAQWWLGRSLKFGALTRLWTAALAITGGHLAGRLANGLSEELFSAAACALALAAAVDLALTGRRRSVAALGLTLGLAMLSGQGYMQIGLLACVFPGLLFFLFTSSLQFRPVVRSFVVAGILAVCVAAILWVPLLHFWPNFVKPTADPDFPGIQSLGPLLLNLVLADPDYYGGLERAGLPYTPAWHVNYLGWIPLLLAGIGLRVVSRPHWRLVAFTLLGLAALYLVGSATLLRWLEPFVPSVVTLMRTPSVITSLAVPLLLVLAGWGLEALWRSPWPRAMIQWMPLPSRALTLDLRWLLVVALLWSVRSTYQAGKVWMNIDSHPAGFYPLLGSTSVAGQQWVEPPFGESGVAVVALQSELKATNVLRPWLWRERETPPAHIRFTRDAVDPADPNFIAADYGLNQVVYPEVHYAAATLGAEVVPCQAQALGGNIDVYCDLPTAGTLLVAENAWSGWSVWRDGQPATLISGDWLSVAAPAGAHQFQFRYRPWDAALGLGLSLFGLLGCLAVFFRWRWPRTRRAIRSGV